MKQDRDQQGLPREQLDMIESCLRVLAGVQLYYDERWDDDYPLARIGETVIRVGHVREARDVLRSLQIPRQSGELASTRHGE